MRAAFGAWAGMTTSLLVDAAIGVLAGALAVGAVHLVRRLGPARRAAGSA